MGEAKAIVLRPIPSREANALVTRVHYSHSVVRNSQFHIGVFLGGKLHGALQFGPSLDKRKVGGLVADTPWNGFIELNRMAFDERLPRNSESRAIGIAMRILRKHAPQLQWVVSFADATQCGDGTIYRASGFVLTGIKENNQIWAAPEGDAREARVALTDVRPSSGCGRRQAEARALCHRVSVTKGPAIMHAMAMRGANHCGNQQRRAQALAAEQVGENRPNGGASMKQFIEAGFKPLPGFQLRYVYFLDPTARERLTVPILPFDEIVRRGAGMYRGQPRARSSDSAAPGNQPGEGGAEPTRALSEVAT